MGVRVGVTVRVRVRIGVGVRSREGIHRVYTVFHVVPSDSSTALWCYNTLNHIGIISLPDRTLP